MSKAYALLSAISNQVNDVTLAKVELEAAAEDQQDLTLKRKRLQHEAKKLVELLEEPNDAVWPRVFQVSFPDKMCMYCFRKPDFFRSILVLRLSFCLSSTYGTRSATAEKSLCKGL